MGAVRTWGKGRMAALSINPGYTHQFGYTKEKGIGGEMNFGLVDGMILKTGDGTVIDGLGPEGVAAATRFFGQRASRLQSGYVFHYAFAMVIGVVLLVTWFYLYG